MERCQSLPDAIPMGLRRDYLPRYIENIPGDPIFMRFKFVKPTEIMVFPGTGRRRDNIKSVRKVIVAPRGIYYCLDDCHSCDNIAP